jgi:hypothetical protein
MAGFDGVARAAVVRGGATRSGEGSPLAHAAPPTQVTRPRTAGRGGRVHDPVTTVSPVERAARELSQPVSNTHW